MVTQHTLAPNKKNGRDEKNSLRKPSRFLSSRQEKREWSESRARAWGERARKKSAAPSTSLINETQRRVTKASRPKNVRVRKKKHFNGRVVHTFQILHYFRRQILALLHPLQWISPTCITNERKTESVQVSDYLLPPVLRPLINYL